MPLAARVGIALLLCLLPACGTSVPPKPSLIAEDPDLVIWPRGEKAIRLTISADRKLNMYMEKAHSVQLCVYQLEKQDPFLELVKTQEGIAKLLAAERFDPTVKSVERLFVQPLEEAVFALDRAEKATFVAVVCGYFESTPEESYGIWEIKPQKTETSRFMRPALVTYSAGSLDVHIRLAAHTIMESMPEKEVRPAPKKVPVKIESSGVPIKQSTPKPANTDAEKTAEGGKTS